MTTFAICLFILVVAVVLLVAMHRREHVAARVKLLGVDFSLEATDRKK